MKQKPPTTVLITGATGGLGSALAHLYAAPGMTLILLGRNESRLAEVSARCHEQGSRVITLALSATRSKYKLDAPVSNPRDLRTGGPELIPKDRLTSC